MNNNKIYHHLSLNLWTMIEALVVLLAVLKPYHWLVVKPMHLDTNMDVDYLVMDTIQL